MLVLPSFSSSFLSLQLKDRFFYFFISLSLPGVLEKKENYRSAWDSKTEGSPVSSTTWKEMREHSGLSVMPKSRAEKTRELEKKEISMKGAGIECCTMTFLCRLKSIDTVKHLLLSTLIIFTPLHHTFI